MSKSSKKLAVKKETLRQLDARQLEQVNGGVALEWVILKVPQTVSGGCTTELFALNNYDWYRY